jgi:hypothetical protein
MEYFNYVADEEEVLEYIEDLMSAAAHGSRSSQQHINKIDHYPGLYPEDEMPRFAKATYNLEAAIGGQAPLDLSHD